MPAENPAAYQQMTSEDLMNQINEELAKLEVEEAELGPGASGAEGLPEVDSEDMGAEAALMDAEGSAPSDNDAEAALGTALASGVSDPASVMNELRAQGFEIVRIGGMEEPPVDEEPQEGEVSMSDARSKAVENAMGGTA